jgi:hypothetical protein
MKKLDGTRDELVCKIRCEAVRISMNKKSRIHNKRADIPTILYENFSEKTYIQAVGFDCLLLPIQSETLDVNQ